MRTWQLTLVVVCIIGGCIGYDQYKKHQEKLAFNRRWDLTLLGNQVLSVPAELKVQPLEKLLAIESCEAGMFIPGHSICHGEGVLFGIPAYLDVERTDAKRLHFLEYTFQLPAKSMLIEHLTQLFGPAHQADRLPPDLSPREYCWPLTNGQEVVMESDDPEDGNPSVSVFVYSEVAANQWREMEDVPDTCARLPLIPKKPAATQPGHSRSR